MSKEEFWSCKDLQGSAYLAPSQVRACCQRFFVDGKQQGDVVLLDTEKKDHVSSNSIMLAKQNLITRINNKEKTPCFGCPYLEKKHWAKSDLSQISHLSLEYHSICDLKCTYCSEEYFGGKKVQYDLSSLLKSWSTDGTLENCKSIVWGGGEPTLDPNFEAILEIVLKEIRPKYLRFFTNSVRYNDKIQELLNSNSIFITTSIDAGSEKTYELIRGYQRINKVFENLKSYAKINPNRVTIKYIFTQENYLIYEIEEFLNRITLNNLDKCNFQISFDFTKEIIQKDVMVSIIYLYSKLVEMSVASVYIDDLVWQRISKKWELESDLKAVLAEKDVLKFVANSEDYPEVVIWGTGTIAENIVSKSNFFRNSEIAFFVTSGSEYLATGYKTIGNKKISVLSPSGLLNSNLPIFIAAAQKNPLILEEIKMLGISSNRIIKKLII